MKKIGMLVAIRKEMDAVLSRYGAARETALRCGFEVLTYDMPDYTLHVIHSGPGSWPLRRRWRCCSTAMRSSWW